MDCEHPTTELRRHPISGGSAHYANQCLDCGVRVGNWVKKPDGDVPDWDDTIQERLENESAERRNQADIARMQEAEERRRQYHEYLQSPQWRELRKRVLEQDGYMCRGCLLANASIVHHLTYDHAMQEFCWELVSVCESCHDRYHDGVNIPSHLVATTELNQGQLK